MSVSQKKSPGKPRKQIPIVPGLFSIPSSPGEKPHLIGGKCRKCKEVVFPRQSTCPKCSSENMEEIALSRRGKVHASTVVQYPPQLYKGPMPYAVGQVELPEAVIVPGALTVDNKPVTEVVPPGTEVELIMDKFGEDADGNEILMYKFRLV